MAKKVEEPAEETVERVDPETGEVTYEAATPGADAAEPATEEAADTEPATIHAYEAGEFTPELKKMMGDMRNFILDRIRNNWKPWQQMTTVEQQDLVNAVEDQARKTIRGTVRALNDHDWPYCMVTLGQVTIKGGDKGIEARITCANVNDNRNFLGEHVDSQVMIVVTNAEDFFGARDRVKLDGKGSQMDLPLGGEANDGGGFDDEQAALAATGGEGGNPEQPWHAGGWPEDKDDEAPAPTPEEQAGQDAADAEADAAELVPDPDFNDIEGRD